MSVCPDCRRQQDAWLDSRPSQVLPRLGIAGGAAYDDTPAGVRDNARSRHRAWVALVREQVAGIAADCQRDRHAVQTSGEQEVAA